MEADCGQLRAVSEADSLITNCEVAKELNIGRAMSVWRLKQTGKVGKLSESMPYELASVFFQTVILNCHLVRRYRTAMNYFSGGLWFASRTWSYMTTGWVQCLNKEEASEPFSKPKVKQTMALDTVWYLLPFWSAAAFRRHQNHYIWEVCSASQWDAPKTASPAASVGSQSYSPELPPTTSSSFRRGKMFSQPEKYRKCLRSSSNPESWVFTLQE